MCIKADTRNIVVWVTARGDFHNEPTQLRIKYKIGRVIGEGNFATVKECTEK